MPTFAESSAPVDTCLIIITVHAIMLLKMEHDSKVKLEHRCIICAYFIFLLQHIVEMTVGYVHAIV